MEMSGELHISAPIPLWKCSQYPLTWRLVESQRTSLDAVAKRKIFCPCWELNEKSSGLQPLV